MKLAGTGHDVKVANSRGPDTIDAAALSTGARAVRREEVVNDVEVLILSIPFAAIPALTPLLGDLPVETVVIDTSNYIAARDDRIEAIENGKTDSVWVTEQLGRPIAKAWNSIYSVTLQEMGLPAGHPDRIAAPIAADRARDREVTMALVEETGFDAFDTGPIAESCGSSAARLPIAPRSRWPSCRRHWQRPIWQDRADGPTWPSRSMASGSPLVRTPAGISLFSFPDY